MCILSPRTHRQGHSPVLPPGGFGTKAFCGDGRITENPIRLKAMALFFSNLHQDCVSCFPINCVTDNSAQVTDSWSM